MADLFRLANIADMAEIVGALILYAGWTSGPAGEGI